MAKILPEGLQSTTRDGFRVSFEARLKEAWGQDVGFDPQTPQGQQSRVLSGILAEQEAALVGLFNGLFLGTATGAFLDNWGAAFGVRRLPPTFSIVTAQIRGTPNSTFPAGSVAQTDSGARFSNFAPIRLDGGGFGRGQFVSEEIGAIHVSAGTLTTKVSVVPGWYSIISLDDAEIGRNVETDSAFRARISGLIGHAQVGTLEALEAGLRVLDGVTHVRVLANPTAAQTTIHRMILPASALMVIIRGGEDDAIAEALERVLPLGQITAGSTNIARAGVIYSVQRVTDRRVKIALDLSINEAFPPDGNERIRANLTQYFGGLGLGQWFNVSELNRPIYDVPGHVITTLNVTWGDGQSLPAEASLPASILYTLAAADVAINLTNT